MFKGEAASLQAISKTETIGVPKPLKVNGQKFGTACYSVITLGV